VGLAAAIVHEPKVLVLDEPSNGLDPTQILEMRRLIRELGADRVVLVSSHILPEVEKTCDRVVVMIRGTVRADGSPETLTGATQRLVVEASHPSADEVGLAAVLRGVFGASAPVHAAGVGGGVCRGTLAGGATEEARAGLGAALQAAGWSVRLLAAERRSLESVFISLLEASGEGGGP
jgi:ABC-2 type transport system ATP-binding protein